MTARGYLTKALLLAGIAAWTTATAAAAQPAGAPPPAAAEDEADASSSGEIVVTARKRSESLLRVPVSVGVVTGETIAKYNVADLQGAARAIPNFYIGKQPSVPNISLRGIGTLSTSNSSEQSVGLSIDNVYFGRGRWFQVGLFDLQQIEVLRGPQGVYFGKNTPAGLINISTKGPGRELEAYLKTGYEFKYREKLIEGAIGGPISENFGARLALQYRDSDGWMRNTVTGDREPSMKQILGRLTLDWRPSDDLKLVYKGQYGNSRNDGKQEEVECNATIAAQFRAMPGITEDCVINGRRSGGNGVLGGIFTNATHEYQNLKAQSHGLSIDWDVDEFTVSSVTGYQKIKMKMLFDTDFSDRRLTNSNWPEDSHAFSQEIRVLSPAGRPLQGLLGAYFEDNKIHWPAFQDFAAAGGGTRPRDFKQHGKSWAVFGEATWNVTDVVRLIVGARYTNDKKSVDYDYKKGGPLGNPFGLPSAPLFTTLGYTDIILSDSRTFKNFSPSFIGQWDVSPDVMVYASYKHGFKSGGFDSGRVGRQDVPQGPVSPTLEFRPEKVKAAEIGIKGKALDNRLSFSAVGFYTKITDLQATVFFPATQSSTMLNAASAKIKGFEVDASFQATPGFSLNGAIGLSDSKYSSFPNATCYPGQVRTAGQCEPIRDRQGNLVTPTTFGQDLKGDRLPVAPKWTAAFGFDWKHPLTDGLRLEVGGQANYRSQVFLTLENDPNQDQSGYWLLDARVALAADDNLWSLALVGQNLTDKRYFVGSVPLFSTGGAYARAFGNPRTIQLEATFRLGAR